VRTRDFFFDYLKLKKREKELHLVVFSLVDHFRSTPQLDSFYGGRQDLTAALGFERDGQTIILFRRKLNSSDEADHIIGSDPMQIIWARGQEHGKYVHRPASGLEKESASIADFYKPDELKYHGQGDQRGVTVINFIGNSPQGNDHIFLNAQQIRTLKQISAFTRTNTNKKKTFTKRF
jgi:hypothetical protein